jgi:hypothetical protein
MGLAAATLGTGPSLTQARQVVITALQGVPGVVPYLSKPDEPVAGAAWPRWALTEHEGGKLCATADHELDVYVLLNQGYEPSTVSDGDALLDAVVTALWPVARVLRSQPTLVIFDQQRSMPALLIRVIPRY